MARTWCKPACVHPIPWCLVARTRQITEDLGQVTTACGGHATTAGMLVHPAGVEPPLEERCGGCDPAATAARQAGPIEVGVEAFADVLGELEVERGSYAIDRLRDEEPLR